MKLYDVIRQDHANDKPSEHPTIIATPDAMVEQVSLTPAPHRGRSPKNEGFSWKKMIVIGSAIAFIALLYLVGILFVHAKVTVTERQIPFSLQDTQIELANSATADPGRLSFQTMVVTDSVSRQVFASAVTTSTSKAAGKAVIINQYSKSAQTVRAGTVLTGANGKKYLTTAAAIVPGYTGTASAKASGSVSVGIVAADVGPAYNSDGTTFVVAGWSGAAAKLFSATSAGPITGGQNGAMHTLSDTDKMQAVATLQGALREKLSRETHAQIPSRLVTFPDLQFTSLDANSINITGNTIQFSATMTGTMVSYLIPRDLLEQAIASKAISDHLYPDVSIPALGNVRVVPVSTIPANPKNVPPSITIAVSGQGVIITQVAPDKIQQAVTGIRRDAFERIFSAIPEVDSAKYSLYPFWAPYFPYQPTRIKVIIN